MNKPPVILRSSKLEGPLPLFLFIGLILFSWIVSNTISFFPSCWLQKWTGIPCPFCGGTRCLLAWSHLKWGEAFRWNPVVFLICLSVVIWFGLWIFGVCLRRPKFEATRHHKISGSNRFFVFGLLVALMLNWLYLCWHLR